jgi:hypothetical protein
MCDGHHIIVIHGTNDPADSRFLAGQMAVRWQKFGRGANQTETDDSIA